MAIEVGQRWYVKPEPGAIWTTDAPIRVMAIIEGYIVARFKGAMPFIKDAETFQRDYEQRTTGA